MGKLVQFMTKEEARLLEYFRSMTPTSKAHVLNVSELFHHCADSLLEKIRRRDELDPRDEEDYQKDRGWYDNRIGIIQQEKKLCVVELRNT